LGLHVFTARCSSDDPHGLAARLGRPDLIPIIQQKAGATVSIAIHPGLPRILDEAPQLDLTFSSMREPHC
jgi:hypothetical protein